MNRAAGLLRRALVGIVGRPVRGAEEYSLFAVGDDSEVFVGVVPVVHNAETHDYRLYSMDSPSC